MEMQTKNESSIEEDYVRLLHCPNAILEMLRSQVRKSSPVLATQYKTQQLYPCIQTYSLCGKGNRGKLPDCLEYAIKEKYPEQEGVAYAQYSDGKKVNN